MASKRDLAAQRLGYANQAERERIQRLYKRQGLEWNAGQAKPTPGNLRRVREGLKPRNYAREEQQRNIKRQEKGFTTRSQQRRFLKAQEESRYHPAMERLAENPELMGFDSRTDMTKYDPSRAEELGMSKAEYTKAYFDAFGGGPQSWQKNRHSSTPALHKWFVDINGYLTEGEYDEKYK